MRPTSVVGGIREPCPEQEPGRERETDLSRDRYEHRDDRGPAECLRARAPPGSTPHSSGLEAPTREHEARRGRDGATRYRADAARRSRCLGRLGMPRTGGADVSPARSSAQAENAYPPLAPETDPARLLGPPRPRSSSIRRRSPSRLLRNGRAVAHGLTTASQDVSAARAAVLCRKTFTHAATCRGPGGARIVAATGESNAAGRRLRRVTLRCRALLTDARHVGTGAAPYGRRRCGVTAAAASAPGRGHKGENAEQYHTKGRLKAHAPIIRAPGLSTPTRNDARMLLG